MAKRSASNQLTYSTGPILPSLTAEDVEGRIVLIDEGHDLAGPQYLSQ